MLPLVAYLSALSVAPGESLAVHVGSYGARRYRAELRRIIQGDVNPEGPGYRDEPIPLDLGGERPARAQPIRPGSQGVIRLPLPPLRPAALSLGLAVWPTLPGDGREQGLLELRLDGLGVQLLLDAAGRPCLRLLGGATAVELVAVVPLAARRWHQLAVTLDPAQGQVTLAGLDLESPGAQPVVRTETAALPMGLALLEARIAALSDGQGQSLAHYDGKIDSPVLFEASLSPAAIFAALADPAALSARPDLLAWWDFSQAIETDRILDRSPYRLDGVLLNTPARAMTGWRWRGEPLDWRQRPELYSAIHFHSDDMTDAGWEADFSVTLPNSLTSGVYAVRLVPDGDEDAAYYAVFAVRPPRAGVTGNSIAFLLPTASYLAYANHRLGLDVPGTEVGMGRLVEVDRHHAFLQAHPEVGFSFYEVHGDGSGVFYSSRRRPILDLQPKVLGFLGGQGSNLWQFNADTHILGWLERVAEGYDVITDEDLDAEGLSLLRRYRAVVTGTHPEYHSDAMLSALQGFVDRGGRLLYLGGNGFYWRISFSRSQPGLIECRRSEAGIRPWEPGYGQYHHAFTGEMGGLWRRTGRGPNRLAGVGMSAQGFDVSEPYRLTEAAGDPRAAFIFAGIDIAATDPDDGGRRRIGAFGLSGGGAAGLEVDRAELSLGTPAYALVLASSESHSDVYLMTPEDLLDPVPDLTGTQSPLIRADLTFFETLGGGAVFSVGSIAWAGAMAWNGYDNEIARITTNVLRRFDDPEAFSVPYPL